MEAIGSDSAGHSFGVASTLRLGFVPQMEAAALIAAQECGFFSREQLPVRLVRHASWATVRDGLVFGQLEASQGLAGFGVVSQLGRELFAEPLVALMTLGLGGATVVISKQLREEGVASAADLARWVMMNRAAGPLMLAHNYFCSPQRYLVRQWLSDAGINPDRDVKLSTVMPSLVVELLHKGYLSGFCSSDPMGTIAELEAGGRILARGDEIVPDHPNQALVVATRWLERHGDIAVSLVRAVMRGVQWCHDSENRRDLARMLGRHEYLNASAEALEECLAAGHRTTNAAAMFPSKMHAAWLLTQMVRWGEMSSGADILAIADRCCDATAFRIVAAEMGIELPEDDFPPMPLANGQTLARSQLTVPAPQRAAM
jgi:ABC-type nitrate/sulfonate/bicarbonate transport system substrate-binding protein